MKLTPHATGVVDITPDDLRAFMASHHEGEYVLIDVRQPEEYQESHIAGAKLVPLSEIEARANEVEEAREKRKIFFCRSGRRAGRAAEFFAQARGLPNVFNVAGGMMAWNGRVLPDFPDLKAFDAKGSIKDVLVQAIDLEKGADRLYAALLEHFKRTEQKVVIETLLKAEKAHARAIFAALQKVSGGVVNFDALYESLGGDILEGGAPIDSAIEAAKSVVEHGTIALLELAVAMEFQALDVYRTLAHRTGDEPLRAVFVELAENEKRHAHALLRAIGKAASS